MLASERKVMEQRVGVDRRKGRGWWSSEEKKGGAYVCYAVGGRVYGGREGRCHEPSCKRSGTTQTEGWVSSRAKLSQNSLLKPSMLRPSYYADIHIYTHCKVLMSFKSLIMNI